MREAASRGFFLGSKAPFGYTRVKVNDGVKERPTLEVDPATAPVVKEIFESSLQGNGLKEICKALNDRGITNRGKRWYKGGLHYLLTNEAYTGIAVWGRTSKGEKPQDPVRVEGAWPALISRELFDAVQQAMRDRAPKVRRPASVGSRFLLSGLLKCGVCGRPYSAQGAKSGQFAYYICGTLFREGAGTCSARYLNAPRQETFVVQKIDDRQSIRKIAVLVGGGLKPLRISDKAEAPQGPLPRHESTRNRLPGLAEFAGRCLVGFQQSGLDLLNVGRSDYSDFSRESLCVSRGQLPVWFAAPGVGLPTVWNSPIASGTRAKLHALRRHEVQDGLLLGVELPLRQRRHLHDDVAAPGVEYRLAPCAAVRVGVERLQVGGQQPLRALLERLRRLLAQLLVHGVVGFALGVPRRVLLRVHAGQEYLLGVVGQPRGHVRQSEEDRVGDDVEEGRGNEARPLPHRLAVLAPPAVAPVLHRVVVGLADGMLLEAVPLNPAVLVGAPELRPYLRRELGRDSAADGRIAPAGLRHPSHRTGLATFTAPGSPLDGL